MPPRARALRIAALPCIAVTVHYIDFYIGIVAHREGCSASCSKTIHTARLRSSGENLFLVLPVMTPSSQELGPPANQGRFTAPIRDDGARMRVK